MFSSIHAQSYQLDQLEAHFLQNNFWLIANHFNIDIREAESVQEKLYTNPTLSISEINFWSNRHTEILPPIIKDWGKRQQISIELEQMIETAGKRRKRIELKDLEKKAALYDFEELVRMLKKELRQTYNTLYKINSVETQLKEVIQLYDYLSTLYKRQSDLQNVSQIEYLRVKTELVALELELMHLKDQEADAIQKLQILTLIPNLNISQIDFQQQSIQLSKRLPVDILDIAISQNIGIQRQVNEMNVAQKHLELEQAQRKPDVYVHMNYDRGGNIMKNFVGFGLSVDLPVWDRNKGNIKAGQLYIEQEKAESQAMHWELETEVVKLISQLEKYEKLLKKWDLHEIDKQVEIMNSYRKYLQSKQVSLLEFVDFTQSFRTTQEAYYEALEQYADIFEDLQYIVGIDF